MAVYTAPTAEIAADGVAQVAISGIDVSKVVNAIWYVDGGRSPMLYTSWNNTENWLYFKNCSSDKFLPTARHKIYVYYYGS